MASECSHIAYVSITALVSGGQFLLMRKIAYILCIRRSTANTAMLIFILCLLVFDKNECTNDLLCCYRVCVPNKLAPECT